jgi:hypothetical protein
MQVQESEAETICQKFFLFHSSYFHASFVYFFLLCYYKHWITKTLFFDFESQNGLFNISLHRPTNMAAKKL